MADTVKIVVSDPATGEVLQERTITNDYAVICVGNRYIKNLQVMGTTHMIALAKESSDAR